MRIVVDTNVVFSAILNTNSQISKILLQQKSILNFCTTKRLLIEIERHRIKLLKLSSYSDMELSRVIAYVTSKINFINVQLIPRETYYKVKDLTANIDVDDTEFVALTEYLNAKLWTGDKVLINGLKQKGWSQFISTNELFEILLAG